MLVPILNLEVSIHARQQTSGRLLDCPRWCFPFVFQSTPANKPAGDLVGCQFAIQLPKVSIHARQQTSGRPSRAVQSAFGPLVSIHARQQTSGRHKLREVLTAYALFQSTPANKPAGDTRRYRPWATASSFQSTPANKPAGDRMLAFAMSRVSCFNPRPPTNQRATVAQAALDERDQGVSIHARQQTSGRRACRSRSGSRCAFQSTPANKPAGDGRATHRRCLPGCFNPRPPTNQRATVQCLRAVAGTAVSIHARQQTSGRRSWSTARSASAGFNPRPPTNQRATASRRSGQQRGTRFNPRPPTNQRATVQRRAGRSGEQVSIHARQQTSGRPNRVPAERLAAHVSIHARQQTSGRPPQMDQTTTSTRFQSTPANKPAGDVALTTR